MPLLEATALVLEPAGRKGVLGLLSAKVELSNEASRWSVEGPLAFTEGRLLLPAATWQQPPSPPALLLSIHKASNARATAPAPLTGCTQVGGVSAA